MARLLVACLAIAACRVPDVDLTGKACPCPSGWFCDPGTSTCSRTPPSADARVFDAPVDQAPQLTYRAAVLADMPVAYWRLGEATGTTACDELGANDGTYTSGCALGAAGAIAGDPDTAVTFNGTSCEVMLPDAFAFLGNAPYSIEAWVDVAGMLASFRTVFSKESRVMGGGPIDGYALVESAQGMYVERAVNQSAPTTTPQTIATGRYVHLVGVYDGSSMVLYVDGQPGAAHADTAAMPSFSAIGVIGSDLAGNYFHGAIDEVAIYARALSPARILLHYDLGTGMARD